MKNYSPPFFENIFFHPRVPKKTKFGYLYNADWNEVTFQTQSILNFFKNVNGFFVIAKKFTELGVKNLQKNVLFLKTSIFFKVFWPNSVNF